MGNSPNPSAAARYRLKKAAKKAGFGLGCGPAGGLGDGDGAGGGKFRLLTFKDDLAHETAAPLLVEPDLQHIQLRPRPDMETPELKTIRSADPITPHPLFLKRLQRPPHKPPALPPQDPDDSAVRVELKETVPVALVGSRKRSCSSSNTSTPSGLLSPVANPSPK